MEKILSAPSSDKAIVLARTPIEQVRLCIRFYSGHPFVDIRQYFQSDEGGWLPTKRGVTIPPRLWPAFHQALDQLEAQMAARGLLADEEGEE